MKKRIVVAAGLGLSMAMLTACGAPKTEDLVDKMYEAQMDSFTAEASFEVEVNVEGDDVDGDIKASGDMTMEVMNAQDTDKMLAHVDGSVKYDLLGFLDDKTDFEAYLDADEESAYYNTDGDWYVEDFNLSDSGVDKKLAGKIQDASKEFWYKGTVDKKLEEVSGEKAYVLTVEGTAADFMPVFDILADEVDEFEDLMDEADVDIKDIAKAVPVNVKAYVSKDNGYVLKTELDMAGIDIEAILDAADADLDDLGVDSIEVSALNFTITYSAVNETEVEVPSKVTKNAISYDDYGWDDDYDWDEDYGWDEVYDDGATEEYTLETYLEENNQLDVISKGLTAAADDSYTIDFDIYGNDLYFTMTMNDDNMDDATAEKVADSLAEQMGSMLESQFKSVFEMAHEETGIESEFSVTFEIYGTSGAFYWSDTYYN